MRCEICGEWGGLQRHHIFEGRNRSNSERYGAVIQICYKCHEDIHHHPRKYEWLKENWQERLMRENHWTVEDFISIFRRSYL
jgi:GTPase SAR1 family protein